MAKFFNESLMTQENLYPVSDYVYFYGGSWEKENATDKKKKNPKTKTEQESVKGVMILEEPKYGDSILLGSNTLFYTLAYLLDEDEIEVVNDILDTYINIEQDLPTN